MWTELFDVCLFNSITSPSPRDEFYDAIKMSEMFTRNKTTELGRTSFNKTFHRWVNHRTKLRIKFHVKRRFWVGILSSQIRWLTLFTFFFHSFAETSKSFTFNNLIMNESFWCRSVQLFLASMCAHFWFYLVHSTVWKVLSNKASSQNTHSVNHKKRL